MVTDGLNEKGESYWYLEAEDTGSTEALRRRHAGGAQTTAKRLGVWNEWGEE